MAMTKSTLAVYLLLLGTYQTAQAQTAWGVVNTFQIGGQGAWDYLTPAPETHRLYVPRTTHTMVIDSESGKTIADIPGQSAEVAGMVCETLELQRDAADHLRPG